MPAVPHSTVPLLQVVDAHASATHEWQVVLVGPRLARDARLRRRLTGEYRVTVHDRSREALAGMEGSDGPGDVVIVEQVLLDGRGVDFLRELRIQWPHALRLLILENDDTQVVQHAINDAAVHQVVFSPWQPEQLHLMVRRALESRELACINRYLSRELKIADSVHRQNDSMRNALQEIYSLDRLVFASNTMTEACNVARKAASTDLPVLIEGEIGTGKELMARGIHLFSHRRKLLFLAKNCGSNNDDLLQSELCGHRRGAFTGATTDWRSLFFAANGGTVFLDEISEISPAMQVSLLNFLEESEIRALSGDPSQRTEARIISASNHSLRKLVAEGKFRQDLYDRLRGFELHMPPLRERPEDIPVLVTHMLDKYSSSIARRIAEVTPETMARLSAYAFPGNVWELENEVRRLLALAEDGEFIAVRNLSPEVTSASTPVLGGTDPVAALPGKSLKEKVEALEAQLVCTTLDRCHWNRSKAARELGLSRVGLANKISRYDIHRAGGEEGPI